MQESELSASKNDWNGPGHDAVQPSDIPATGWSQILRRVWKAIGDDQLSLISAALAFYGMLGIFPALTALVAIYGLVFDPHDIWVQSEKLSAVVPADVHSLVVEQLSSLVNTAGAELGFGLLLSLGLLLWSTSTGVQCLIRAVNLAYSEHETRSFVRLRLLAVAFTSGTLLFFALAIALIAIVPQLLSLIGYGDTGLQVVSVVRWPLLGAGIITALSILYRYGPDRAKARWRWVTWGAAVATSIWLAGSALFSWYVERFGSYNETYGTLGAVVVLLLWLYLSAFAVLIGAELDAAMEHQTVRDSTSGPDRPRGERGAIVADSVPTSEAAVGRRRSRPDSTRR